ncbi:hypothetical protein Zm00014a_028499 [Zea mays]|uniref:Uncharacterized protein n=1 Tax=Zea mays TaxID=4577 RepID=A0A3L6EWP9_MAIZE|nr:hypothetical protein Zm00014a_028499 [Zea mays]
MRSRDTTLKQQDDDEVELGRLENGAEVRRTGQAESEELQRSSLEHSLETSKYRVAAGARKHGIEGIKPHPIWLATEGGALAYGN